MSFPYLPEPSDRDFDAVPWWESDRAGEMGLTEEDDAE